MPQNSQSNWKPPDSLGYSSLRNVALTGQGKFLAGIVAFTLLGGFGLGIFLARKARLESRELQMLETQGAPAEATITRLWRSGDKEHEPRVSYRYEYQGSIYSGSVGAPLAEWRQLKVGERLAIRFVPERPSISHPVDWDRRILPAWLPYLITGMFAGIGALLAYRLAIAMRLLAEGRAAPARVTRIGHSKGPIVHYEFEGPGGQIYKGRSHTRKVVPAVGETVCILYEPGRPKRNALYPMDLVRLDR